MGEVCAVAPVTLPHCGSCFELLQRWQVLFLASRGQVITCGQCFSAEITIKNKRQCSALCRNSLFFSLVSWLQFDKWRWRLTLQLCCTTLCFRWQTGFTAPGRCMTCSLTSALSEDTWWPVEVITTLLFPSFFFSSPADALKLSACTTPPAFKAWGNFCKAAGTFLEIVTKSLLCLYVVVVFFLFMYSVGTFRRWAALTARTAHPRKQSGETTSLWSQRGPTGLRREWVSCGTRLWCVCRSLCARRPRSCATSF